MPFSIEFARDKKSTKPRSKIRIFLMTFIAVFLIVALQHLGIKAPKIVSPLPFNLDKADIMHMLLPKLQEKKNNFKLSLQSSFIPTSYADSPVESANAYVVVDYDSGEVLAEKALGKPVAIASLTKIMTAVVALDLASSQELFTISETAANEIPTKIGVNPGDKLTLQELLQAALLTSGNDAAQAIKEGIDKKYGEPVFIRAMNAKATALGLHNSHFENPQGFDGKQHFSTAEDVAILSRYALEAYPLIADIVQEEYAVLPETAMHKRIALPNWNGLLGVYPNVSGVKIGNTGAAQRTTVVTAERNGKKLLVVVLGAPRIQERDLWAAQLLDRGFSKSQGLAPIQVTEEQLLEKYRTWSE